MKTISLTPSALNLALSLFAVKTNEVGIPVNHLPDPTGLTELKTKKLIGTFTVKTDRFVFFTIPTCGVVVTDGSRKYSAELRTGKVTHDYVECAWVVKAI